MLKELYIKIKENDLMLLFVILKILKTKNGGKNIMKKII